MPANNTIEALEREAPLPDGGGERFSGYAIIGLPFESGHVLALRRFPASSIGSGYTSVWHRDPAGRWTFYSTLTPDLSCARYFGGQVERNVVTRIDIEWVDAMQFRVVVGEAIEWHVGLGTSPTTRLLNAVAGAIPERSWQMPTVLRLMGVAAAATLGAGRLTLTGLTPNGHRFISNPRRFWLIESSHAVVDDVSLGPPGLLPSQPSLGDFLMPRRGLFALARLRLEQPLKVRSTRASRSGSCTLVGGVPHDPS
jgi:hypothetical protein